MATKCQIIYITILFFRLIKMFNNLFLDKEKFWNVIHQFITLGVSIIGRQNLGLKKNGTYIIKL
jgi:hypothetical protein